MTASKPLNRKAALAFLQKHVDVAAERGDGLRLVQEEFGLEVMEVSELFWDAFTASGKKSLPGSIARRLEDSESPGSFPYAQHMDFEPDTTAPVLKTDGTVKIGSHQVQRLALGCMRLVSKGGLIDGAPASAFGLPHSPESNRHALLNAVHVCGIQYLDASRGYGPWPGAGERLLCEWVAPRPANVVVASKVGYAREPSGGWVVDLDPGYITREIQASHKQFGGRIPLLYLVVRSTPTTPVVNRPKELARSLEPLAKAQRDGLVENIGVANVTAEELDVLRQAAPISIVQNRFALASLTNPSERAVLEGCGAAGIPFVAWGLFGEGVLPRPELPPGLEGVAAEHDVTAEELTIALLLAVAPHVMVLPGPGRRETIYSRLRAANLRLDPAVVDQFVRGQA